MCPDGVERCYHLILAYLRAYVMYMNIVDCGVFQHLPTALYANRCRYHRRIRGSAGTFLLKSNAMSQTS